MTIEVYACNDGCVTMNGRPLTSRGDEIATWPAAHVIVGAHLVSLARELAVRRPAQTSEGESHVVRHSRRTTAAAGRSTPPRS